MTRSAFGPRMVSAVRATRRALGRSSLTRILIHSVDFLPNTSSPPRAAGVSNDADTRARVQNSMVARRDMAGSPQEGAPLADNTPYRQAARLSLAADRQA